jgi:hypothetical protein
MLAWALCACAVDLKGDLWHSLIEATGQSPRFGCHSV